MPGHVPVAALVALLLLPGSVCAQDAVLSRGELLQRLMVELESDDWGTRQRAAQSLGGVEAEEAKPALITALDDPARFDVHPAALRALGEIGGLTETELGRVIAALSDPNPIVAGSAARALCEDPGVSVPAVLALADLCEGGFVAPPTGDADAKGWPALVGRTFEDSAFSRGGDGVTWYVRFAERDGVRFAWFVDAVVERHPPPPPPDDGGPAVPGGAQQPGPVPAPVAPQKLFFPLEWRVRCRRLNVVSEDDRVWIDWRDPEIAKSERWALAPDAKSLVKPHTRGHSSTFYRRDGSGLASGAGGLALQTLGYVLGRDVPLDVLGELLARRSPGLAGRAVAALRGREDAEAYATPILRFAVTGPRYSQEPARDVFVSLPPGAAEEALRDALLSDDVGLRQGTLQQLYRMRPHTKLAAALLGEWVVDGAPFENANVYHALDQLGPDALPALPGLLRVIELRDRPYSNAIGTIGKIGPAATDALPALVNIARTRPGYGHGRLQAARAIAKIDPDHPELPGFVVACVADPNDNVAAHALLWLRVIDPIPEGTVDAVIALGRRAKAEIRRDAATSLGEIGGERADVRETLVALIDDENSYVVIAAARSLAVVSPGHYRVVRALVSRLEDEDWSIRWHAAMALEEVGPAAKAALPRLRRSRDDGDEHGHVRRAAKNAIEAISAQ